MIVVILVAIVALVLGAVELGLIPPLHATVIARMRDGWLVVEKGQLRGNASQHIEAILREARVTNGFVALASGRRVYFSRQIPPDIHQRLRNVLLNHFR